MGNNPVPASCNVNEPILRDDGWQTIPGKYPYPLPSQAHIPTLFVERAGECHVHALGGKQFLIETQVSAMGEEKTPRVLVDTGAQPNLVRVGLFPGHLFHDSPRPLCLSAANKQRVEGGKRVVPLTLKFIDSYDGRILSLKGLFYEADIPVDMILSNGWMARNKIIPLPEFSQLGIREKRDIRLLKSFREVVDDQADIDTTPLRLRGTPNSDAPRRKSTNGRSRIGIIQSANRMYSV